MDMKRRAARGIAVLAIALAAGHFVQNMGRDKEPRKVASSDLAQKPTMVETVAAGPEAPKPVAAASAALLPEKAAPALPEKPLTQAAAPAEPVAKPVELAVPTTPAPTPSDELTKPGVAQPVLAEKAPEPPEPAQVVAPVAPTGQIVADCGVSLDLLAEPNAMIGITLVAPCNPNQRVVLSHAGLAITGQTTATGALFTSLPALESAAKVEAFFADGARQTAEVAVPEMAMLRRFGVQWQADDSFQVHAFENGATYGDPDHISAADPQNPVAGQTATGGFLNLVGDSLTENPLLAEIYTYPADSAAKPEVIVEAAVTDKTCGRELIGETLNSIGGTVFVTDLSLTMPDCDAVGDYLVLKNLALDMNMAAAN